MSMPALSRTEPAALSLPPEWMERIFAAMRQSYGTTFDRQWSAPAGLDDAGMREHADAQMRRWGRELAGFMRAPEAIRYALDNLPEFPPNLPEFKALCMRRPEPVYAPMRLAAPQTFLARERTAVEEAWPGDVIGVMDRGTLRIGDTLSEGADLEFRGIPRFAPEHFARVVLQDPMRRKQLDAGLRQLTEEGAAQVFFTSPTEVAGPTPIVGAVGMLQFDVMLHRLEHEYGVRCKLEKVSGRYPRWVVGPLPEIERVSRERGALLLFDSTGQPLILFEDQWAMKWTLDREKALAFHDVAP